MGRKAKEPEVKGRISTDGLSISKQLTWQQIFDLFPQVRSLKQDLERLGFNTELSGFISITLTAIPQETEVNE